MDALKNAETSRKVRAGWLIAQALFCAIQVLRQTYLLQPRLTLFQLAAFFFIASVGVWLDEISKHIMGARPALLPMCLAFYIISVVLVIPWLSLAYTAIRHESARLMAVFFALSCIYISGCGTMFVSTTFRQTFVNWPFFASVYNCLISWRTKLTH
jgi:hypothetical protein